MQPDVLNLEEWISSNPDRVYGFLVYKRLFTPYEQQEAFVDESEFEDIRYSYGKIREAVYLRDGNWLLGFNVLYEDDPNDAPHDLEYHLLSDIKLFSYDWMQHKFDPESDDESGV